MSLTISSGYNSRLKFHALRLGYEVLVFVNTHASHWTTSTGGLYNDRLLQVHFVIADLVNISILCSHDKKTTQWDHPEMVVLLADLSKFNSTKFSAYRAAQKLRKMQKTLGRELIVVSILKHLVVSYS